MFIRALTITLVCSVGQAALPGACAKWCLAGMHVVVDPATGACAGTCTACPSGTFKAQNGYSGCTPLRSSCDARQRKVFGGSSISDVRCEPCAVSNAACPRSRARR